MNWTTRFGPNGQTQAVPSQLSHSKISPIFSASPTIVDSIDAASECMSGHGGLSKVILVCISLQVIITMPIIKFGWAILKTK
jgi:hypothetical protein